MSSSSPDLQVWMSVDIQARSTALILAASARSEAAAPLVRLLLDAGANATGSSGDHALERAAVNGYVDVMRLLLGAGANPNALIRDNNPNNDTTVLMRTSQSPRVEPVELLLASGARINTVQRNGDNALRWAVGTANNGAVIRLLLANGANPNIQDSLGRTPLMKAIGSGATRYPATGYIDTTRSTQYIDNVRALIEGGADVSLKDQAGATALTFARTYGHPEMVALLLKAGG
jgi:ankyrin repeat protein